MAEYLVGKIRIIGENLSERSMRHLEGARKRSRTTTLRLNNGEKVKVQGFEIKYGIYEVAWNKMLNKSTIKEIRQVLKTAVTEISTKLSGKEIVAKQRKKFQEILVKADEKLSEFKRAEKEKSIKNLLNSFKEADRFLNRNRKTAYGIIDKVLSRASKIMGIERIIRDIKYLEQNIKKAESDLQGAKEENTVKELKKSIDGYKQEKQVKEKDLNSLVVDEREALKNKLSNLKAEKSKLINKRDKNRFSRFKWLTNRRISKKDKEIESSNQKLQQVRKDTQDLQKNKRSIETKVSSEYKRQGGLEGRLAELGKDLASAIRKSNKILEKKIEAEIDKTKDSMRKLNREMLKKENGLFEKYIWLTRLQNWRVSGNKKVNSIILERLRDLVDMGEEASKRTREHFWILENIEIKPLAEGKFQLRIKRGKIQGNREIVKNVVKKINKSIKAYESYRRRGGRKSFSLYRHQVLILLDMLFSSRRAFELVTGYGKTDVLTPLLAECSRELFKERFTRELLIFTD